jgi:hypothetical protein
LTCLIAVDGVILGAATAVATKRPAAKTSGV